MTAQTNVNFRLSPSNSHQTHIVLIEDAYTVLGGSDGTVDLQIQKKDFIDSAVKILYSLPLYKKAGKYDTLLEDALSYFQDAIKKIDGFFGANADATYSVQLSTDPQGRRCLQGLSTGGFNIRDFLIEDHSELEFDHVSGINTLRVFTNSVIDFKPLAALPRYADHVIIDIPLDQSPCTNMTDFDAILSKYTGEIVPTFSDKSKKVVLGDAQTFAGLRLHNCIIDNGLSHNAVDASCILAFTPGSGSSAATAVAPGAPSVPCAPSAGAAGGVGPIVNVLEKLYSEDVCGIRIYKCNPFANSPTASTKEPLQKIVFGAPGTGKSFEIDKNSTISGLPAENKIRTIFHPESDYSSFVGSYKPTMEPVNGKEEIVYKFMPQAFTKAYVRAWKCWLDPAIDQEEVFLIIEEINRGNCAQIFGDLFQLLDRDRFGYSQYAISADIDLSKHLAKEFGPEKLNLYSLSAQSGKILTWDTKNSVDSILSGIDLCLPPNLHIWATMNTSDQGLFPMDSAFKRRWLWKYIPIKKGDHDIAIVLDKIPQESSGMSSNALPIEYDWWSFLLRVNEKIELVNLSSDKKLGFWFVKAVNRKLDIQTFVSKVISYLWNDVFKNVDKGSSHNIFRFEYHGTEQELNPNDSKALHPFDHFYRTDNGLINTQMVYDFLGAIKGLQPNTITPLPDSPSPASPAAAPASDAPASDAQSPASAGATPAPATSTSSPSQSPSLTTPTSSNS